MIIPGSLRKNFQPSNELHFLKPLKITLSKFPKLKKKIFPRNKDQPPTSFHPLETVARDFRTVRFHLPSPLRMDPGDRP